MDKSKFYKFLERLISYTHPFEEYDHEGYKVLIHEICHYYDLAKGVTEFYPNVTMETLGQGEYFCDFDNGHADEIYLQIRVTTDTKAVVKGTIYRATGAKPLSDENYYEIETMLRVILRFLSLRRLQKVVERFGFFDEDGYPNFRSFSRFLDISNNENSLSGKYAIHFDLHNFTLVNQEVGRHNGDIIMRNYYQILCDTVDDDGIFCRLGGDKFIGIFSENSKDKVLEILSGVPVSFDDEHDRRIIISASAGIYQIPQSFTLTSTGDIMDKILMPSAIAKKGSESACIFYNQEMKNQSERMKWVKRKFREALKKNEFKVFYQPKVDIETKEIIGAEALCRWFRAGTIIQPLDFIPILEQGMEICDLDFYMLDSVCKDIRRWLDEGKNVVKVSVNLSRKHLVDVDLLEHIIGIIDSNNVPHEYIEMELTETTTDVQFKDLKRTVTGLHNAGVSTAVDDFGIGYSSLNLIREIPWDVLKVDKAFLPDDDDLDDVTNVMFKHVISMAHEIGMKCVIEGVETPEQISILRQNNCHIAQGYFFDKPLPVEEFEKRLDKKNYK